MNLTKYIIYKSIELLYWIAIQNFKLLEKKKNFKLKDNKDNWNLFAIKKRKQTAIANVNQNESK